MVISVEVDFKEARKELTKVERDQLPFATAVTLTRMAQAAQKEIREVLLPKKFELRNKHIVRGIRITPARKSRLVSEVFTRDQQILEKQERGGPIPFKSKYRFVPVARDVVKTKRGLPRKNFSPREIFQSLATSRKSDASRFFISDLPSGAVGLFGFTRFDRAPRLLYIMIQRASINERLEFVKTAIRVVTRDVESIFARELALAVKTRR